MSGHTKGPWVGGCDLAPDGFAALRISAADGVTVVGGCGCCGSPYGDNPADVPLLLAAPDMFDALVGLIYGADKATRDRARVKSISIIAKIEGGKHDIS